MGDAAARYYTTIDGARRRRKRLHAWVWFLQITSLGYGALVLIGSSSTYGETLHGDPERLHPVPFAELPRHSVEYLLDPVGVVIEQRQRLSVYGMVTGALILGAGLWLNLRRDKADPLRAFLAAHSEGELVSLPPELMEPVRAQLVGVRTAVARVQRDGDREAAKRLATGVTVLVSKNDNRCTPSVIVHKRMPVLIIPIGLFVLMHGSEEQRSWANALLAHEYGHIAHGDADVWQTTSFALSINRVVVLAWLTAILGAAMFIDPRFLASPQLWATIIPLSLVFAKARRDSKRIRLDSELLADSCAIVSGYRDGLIGALCEFVRNPKKPSTSVHPKLAERLAAAIAQREVVRGEEAAAVG